MATTAQSGKGSRSARGGQPRGAARASEGTERDKNYDLIAVLYRSLKNAERCTQYCEDAEESGDNELVEFFEETCDEYKARAAKARELLAARLEDGEISDEDDDEEEEED